MTCHVAQTCRKSCQRKFSMPTRLSAFLQALVLACPSGLLRRYPPASDGRLRSVHQPAHGAVTATSTQVTLRAQVSVGGLRKAASDFRRLRSTTPSSLGRHSDRVDERRERWRYLASPWVIDEEPGKRRTPILEDSRQRAGLKRGDNLILDQVGKAETGQRGIEDHALVVEDERPVYSHLQLVAALLELPLIDRACRGQSEVDAAV